MISQSAEVHCALPFFFVRHSLAFPDPLLRCCAMFSKWVVTHRCSRTLLFSSLLALLEFLFSSLFRSYFLFSFLSLSPCSSFLCFSFFSIIVLSFPFFLVVSLNFFTDFLSFSFLSLLWLFCCAHGSIVGFALDVCGGGGFNAAGFVARSPSL